MLTDRITQVHNYASLIRNFAKDEFDITLFYGYLIGDRINANELKFHGTGCKPSHDQEYYYCPNKPVDCITLWHGIKYAIGLLPMADPTALLALGLSSFLAISL